MTGASQQDGPYTFEFVQDEGIFYITGDFEGMRYSGNETGHCRMPAGPYESGVRAIIQQLNLGHAALERERASTSICGHSVEFAPGCFCDKPLGHDGGHLIQMHGTGQAK